MKTKYVYVTTAILCIFLVLVVFKLNDYYKSEKTQATQNQMLQQNASLKTSISTQLGQLKNILSSYSYHIDENKLNWMQLDPLMTLAQTHISQAGSIEVKNIFSKSGSKTERWSKDFLQKALGRKKYSNKNIQVDLFQTKSGDKYLALTFSEGDSLAATGFEAVTVVGEANYFQKFFDLNRSQKVTHVLVTDSNIVAGHNESDYVATVTSESELNLKNYFIETEDLRSSNLKIISYAAKSVVLSFLNIPMMLLGLILGFSCLFVGVLFYAFRPIEKIIQDQKKAVREELFQKTVQDTVRETAQDNRAAAIPDLDAIFGAQAQKPLLPPQKKYQAAHVEMPVVPQIVLPIEPQIKPLIGLKKTEVSKDTDMKLAMPDQIAHQAAPEDIDLDQILNLDQFDQDDTSENQKPSLDLKKEFSTTQFKIDSSTLFVENPEIQFQKNEKSLDQFKVRIRGPQKT